ncbi:MAG: hypothetical protein K6B46_04075 [Opitutales bacterium]|nr:hypothetical protein [Opitutales bacterium]
MDEMIEKMLSEQVIEPSPDFANRICSAIAAERAIDKFLEQEPVEPSKTIKIQTLTPKNHFSLTKVLLSFSSMAASIAVGLLVISAFIKNIDERIDDAIAQDCQDEFETLIQYADLLDDIDSQTLEIFAYNE